MFWQAASVIHSAPSSTLKAPVALALAGCRAYAGAFFHITHVICARAFLADAVILRNMPRQVHAGGVGDAVRAQQAVGAAAVACMAGHRRDAFGLVHITHVICARAFLAEAIMLRNMAGHVLTGLVHDTCVAQYAGGAVACALTVSLADAGKRVYGRIDDLAFAAFQINAGVIRRVVGLIARACDLSLAGGFAFQLDLAIWALRHAGRSVRVGILRIRAGFAAAVFEYLLIDAVGPRRATASIPVAAPAAATVAKKGKAQADGRPA